MATDQELKQLNKTVTEAVNILKLYVGNSAQVKSMNEKERKAIDKWLNVVDLAEEREKRQRAFTDRVRDDQGRFIKKQEQQSKQFMGIASSIKGMFKNVTSSISSSIKSVAMGVTSHLKNFFSQLKNHFLSLFGEESEWFGILSSIKDAITGFAGSIINWIWKKTPNWAKKMIKYLQALYTIQAKQMKLDYLSAGGKKKGKLSIMGILGALVFAIGAAIGAFMHRYFFLITKLPIFGKITGMFKTLESLPFIGRLLKAIKFGFKWLGWPLTILLSLIDFIKAYQSTEGTIWEKIKSGLWAAVEGIIEMPIRFLTWAAEKILGWFNIKFDGKDAADKMLGVIRNGFFLALKGWELIFQQLGESYDWIKPRAMALMDKLMGVLDPIVSGFVNFFKGFWNNAIDFWKNKLSIGGMGTGWMDSLKIGEDQKQVPKTEPKRYSVAATVAEYERKKAEEKKKHDDAVAENIKLMGEELSKSNRQTEKAISSIATIQNNANGQNTGNDTKQVPDEIDNLLMSAHAFGGAMD